MYLTPTKEWRFITSQLERKQQEIKDALLSMEDFLKLIVEIGPVWWSEIESEWKTIPEHNP